MRLETWANVFRASVQSYPAFTARVWDLAVRRTFVPIVIIALARVVACQRLQSRNQQTLVRCVSFVVKLANGR